MPGLQQRLQVAHIELSPQTKKELDERFVLIYTGQSKATSKGVYHKNNCARKVARLSKAVNSID